MKRIFLYLILVLSLTISVCYVRDVIAATCDAGACAKSPTSASTIDVGGSVNHTSGHTIYEPNYVFCDVYTANHTIQFKKSTDPTYVDMTTTSLLKTAQAQPQNIETCDYGPTPNCANCITPLTAWTVVANTSSGGFTYNLRVKVVNDNTGNTSYASFPNITVNAAAAPAIGQIIPIQISKLYERLRIW